MEPNISSRKPWNGRLPLETINTLKSLSTSTGKSQSDLVALGIALLNAEKKSPLPPSPMPIHLPIHDNPTSPETYRHPDQRIDTPPTSPAMSKALSDLNSLRSRQPLSKPGGKLL